MKLFQKKDEVALREANIIQSVIHHENIPYFFEKILFQLLLYYGLSHSIFSYTRIYSTEPVRTKAPV